jgi:GNAT superfamily N-acetyltransferase
MAVPDAVARAALFPVTDIPPPPPDFPGRQLRRDGFVVELLPGAPHATVLVEAIDDRDVGAVVSEVRGVLRAEGMRRAAWLVAEAGSPPGLADRLRASFGMRAWDDLPLEPRYAAMALAQPPGDRPSGIEARAAASFEEFQAANRVAEEAFVMPAEDAEAFRAQERLLWQTERRHADFFRRSFVAIVDGRVVGGAALVFGRNAAFLAGGFTDRQMRGRGVYRALVRARWEAAVERGTPALTVGAGKMSRPILERLGFQTVGWVDCLRDDLDSPQG